MKTPEPQIKQKNPRSSEKKQQWQHWFCCVARRPILLFSSLVCRKFLFCIWNSVATAAEVIGVTFLTPAPVPKKVTPAPDPAPELIGNLHSDSC